MSFAFSKGLDLMSAISAKNCYAYSVGSVWSNLMKCKFSWWSRFVNGFVPLELKSNLMTPFGSSRHYWLITEPGQEANGNNLGMSFRFFIK